MDSNDSQKQNENEGKYCVSKSWDDFRKSPKYLKAAEPDSGRLSFICHALAIQLLDSEPVTTLYSSQKVQNSFSKVERSEGEITITDEKISVKDFIIDTDTTGGRASMLSVTRFINQNSQNVIKEVEALDSNGLSKARGYNSETSFGTNEGQMITVTSKHEFTGEFYNYTQKHLVYILEKKFKTENWIKYEDISVFLGDLDRVLGDLDRVLGNITAAYLIRQILRNDFTDVVACKTTTGKSDEIDQLVTITYLLFVCEPSRNPAAFIHHQMLLDLRIGNHITWKMFFDLMPMCPKYSIQRACRLNQLYQKYLPSPYQYDKRVVEGRAKLLIQAEATVVKIWLNKIKEINRSDLAYTKNKDVINSIKTSINVWYGIDLNNHPEEDEYTEDQLISFLKPEKPSDYTVLTDWTKIGSKISLTPLIVPICRNHICCAGLLVRKQEDEKVQLVCVDPLNTLNAYPEIVDSIQLESATLNIVNLINPLHNLNGDDYGPFVIHILKSLAKVVKELIEVLDNWDAERIIELVSDQEIKELKEFLEQPQK